MLGLELNHVSKKGYSSIVVADRKQPRSLEFNFPVTRAPDRSQTDLDQATMIQL